jgi:hypothetical protein
MEEDEFFEKPKPTWEKPCERCGHTVARYRGSYGADCDHCGASYNAGGQRLRDNWRDNPSTYDDEIGDMEGYEIAALRNEDY